MISGVELDEFILSNEVVEVDELDLNDVSNFRSRCFVMVLWQEDKSHMAALELVKRMESLYILHDDEGKPHYHVLIRFKNPRYRQAVADLLHITYNYIFKPINVSAYVRYMCHRGKKYKDKFQYSSSLLCGSLVDWGVEIVDAYSYNDDDKTYSLFEYIKSRNSPISFSDFYSYSHSVGLGKIVRKQVYFWKHLIDENNSSFFYDLTERR